MRYLLNYAPLPLVPLLDLQFVTDLSVLLCLVHRSLHPYAEPIVQGLVQRQLVLDLFPNKSRDTIRGQ